MIEVSEEQLYVMADELALKWWGVKYDGIIELRNRRWKNINGRFWAPLPSNKNALPIIEMCKKRNSERTIEEVKGTLLHELVHWRLFSLGIPHRDIDPEFIKEAIRVGAPISKTRKAQRAYKKYMNAVSNEKGVNAYEHRNTLQ